jgi:hypothetical protein
VVEREERSLEIERVIDGRREGGGREILCYDCPERECNVYC